ncbi:phytanoyl-CoA dioxygenase family protein [Blastopirellula sp. JC732]|uniref:Phytanoyl-CoA dioxygenase family protein n=1 Tax=Blastopirellula sediminis TaxID=2894196 RepID=A0A9X1MQY1_9BACT|nr:phytanoyl-CoA dioxygenase family protein [Blastopirellula sediminis]MCC9605626.1 phytanoyl-CoA dioxygenase family protein [Blastopirellula sediminis]MCC9631074.1 phytanoyl-CoA dioxygenase family protein [Blastopirellula sediminis]
MSIDDDLASNVCVSRLNQNGFALLPSPFTAEELDQITADLTVAIAESQRDGESIRTRAGAAYAARNVLSVYPAVAQVWRKSSLVDLLLEVLGAHCGLVRVLYFDKPPEKTWSLPWHKDLTIAVREHVAASGRYEKPTLKAGVPHVEAPLDLLQQMLTLRIHLDDVDAANGALQVLPGSHKTGKAAASGTPHLVACRRGDVLAMRPLLSHASGESAAETRRHRRILHLEFAATPQLEEGFAWQLFQSVT